MSAKIIESSSRLDEILDRLCAMSIDDYYNPYRLFEWPDELPSNTWWMSPELTTTHRTEIAAELPQSQLHELSRLESINFYSLNVHGIRELLIEVTKRIHTSECALPSKFFHHFIGEENEHMWFFAEFCRRYGGKIYKQPQGGAAQIPPTNAESLLVFARILIFEELVDHYNTKMANDERLHETIRNVNRIHHQDESRHIAFGRELVKLLFNEFRRTAGDEDRKHVESFLKRYMSFSFESLFNPQVYRDAGLDDPLSVRSRLLNSPTRRGVEQRVFRKTLAYLVKTGVFADRSLGAAGTAGVAP
jgi:hypothetical protein